MSETEKPKRGPGRPRVNPEEGSRRNVTFQVSVDLHEKLKHSSEKSGLSVSREIEQCIQDRYSGNTALAGVNQAMNAAITAAVEAALAREDRQTREFFGGSDGFLVAKSSADLFKSALSEAFQEFSVSAPSDVTPAVIASLLERMKSGQEDIVKTWHNGFVLAHVLQSMSASDIGAALDKAPELKSKLEAKFERIFPKAKPRGDDE